ncbi:tetraacyldisaccharide 4'-kinase [Zunongwangia sp.]|uniref:tetraacyldisaccharide 4'-kinase n=1 Tax=Zunongwangia sp. TaxID=1965325 RepID=UPI003AA88055
MKLLRKILFPFSILYRLIVSIRNKLFDINILKSKSYNFPVICIGNLSAGGTGKTPMVELLLRNLNFTNVAVLSRGYKRSSKGFLELKGSETAEEVGDEPLQFKTKFPESIIAVDANRQEGIDKLRNKNAEIILLDDAFQHRKVKAGLNILLTAFNDLYTNDFMLPTGNLRESVSGAKRAQIVIVTKCPPNITLEEREHIRFLLRLESYQHLYFTTIAYAEKLIGPKSEVDFEELSTNFTVVTGIAKPAPFIAYLKEKKLDFEHLAFADHHSFSDSEIEELNRKSCILTTEKDYMRLQGKLSTRLFYLPIETKFIENEADFLERVANFITEFK